MYSRSSMKVNTTISLSPALKQALLNKSEAEQRPINAIVAEWIEENASEYIPKESAEKK